MRLLILARRRLPLWRNAGVIFIHIPKNAGSSVNDALYGRFMGHVPASLVRYASASDFANLPSFALLRNPLERCLSAYYFARAGRGEGKGVIAAIANPERYQIDEFTTFDRFVNEWLAKQDLARIDPVFRTQSSYVCDRNGQPMVTHLGTLGEIAKTEAWLRKTLGQEVQFGHTNHNNRTSRPQQVSAESRKAIEHIYAVDYRLIQSRGPAD